MHTAHASDLARYVELCGQSEVQLFPVAFMKLSDFSGAAEVEDWLAERKEQGFLGVKLHPRLARFDFQHPLLPTSIELANRAGLIPLLCTYFYSGDPICRTLSVETLRDLLYSVPDQKLILLHSGLMRVLELSEITRPFKKVLLDLSFTLCEFAGSSVDMDLRYVMDRCRGRTCIGSDSPDFRPSHMRTRFEQLTQGFTLEHREQLAFRNLLEFTGFPSELIREVRKSVTGVTNASSC